MVPPVYLLADTTPQGEHHHVHRTLEVPAGRPVPALDLVVTQDPVSGWNLQLQTENFRFAPENVNHSSLFNEGHAHLYVNGEKIARIYSNWYHLSELPPGRNEIRVTLNANGHEALTHKGVAIEDTEIVEVE